MVPAPGVFLLNNMPYSVDKPKDLPAHVQKMGADKQAVWVKVFNSAFARCNQKGSGDCEGAAMAQANSVAEGKSRANDGAEQIEPRGFLSRAWRRVVNFGSLFGRKDGEAESPIERAVDMGQLLQLISEQLNGPADAMKAEMPYMPIDLYHEGSAMFLIVAHEGELYRIDVTLDANDVVTLGDPVPVMKSFTPVPEQQRGITVTRGADGRRRWTMIAASAVLNRMGEIDSTILFDSFVANAKLRGMPYLGFWHQGERLRFGQADFVARDDALYIASGLFDETDMGRACADALERDANGWGVSIGYVPLEEPAMVEVTRDIRVPVYTKGWNRELSILPEPKAASWFTVIQTGEVKNRMRKDVADALAKLVGDKLAEFAQRADDTNKVIRESGMVMREGGEAAVAEGATATAQEQAPVAEATHEQAEAQPAQEQAAQTIDAKPAEPPAPEVLEVDDAFITRLVGALAGSPVIQALTARVDEVAKLAGTMSTKQLEIARAQDDMSKRLEAVERDDDEKRRAYQADMPAGRKTVVTYRARENRAPDKQQNGDGKKNLAAVAGGTLANMKMPRPPTR